MTKNQKVTAQVIESMGAPGGRTAPPSCIPRIGTGDLLPRSRRSRRKLRFWTRIAPCALHRSSSLLESCSECLPTRIFGVWEQSRQAWVLQQLIDKSAGLGD